MVKQLILSKSRQNTRQVISHVCNMLDMNVVTGQHGADVNHVETSETFFEAWRCGYSVAH